MEFRKRPCPVCASHDDSTVFAESNYDASRLNAFSFASRKFPEMMHYRLVRCPDCSVLYASPAPVGDVLEDLYREAEYDSAEESRHAARVYFQQLSRFLASLPDRAGALDIGAGDGAFLEMLLGAGFRGLVGVEPSQAPIAAARPDVRGLIRQALFSGEDFTAESLSLVTCFQTLEHLNDPLEVCASSFRILKPGGAFFTVAHNYRSVSAKLLGMRSPIYDIEHLQLFSPASIERLLGRAGFSGIRVFPLANSYPLHYWLKIMPLGTMFKKKVIELAKATGIGYLPLSIRAGNMAAIGFKALD
jgi:SAM-dependent methyltransferase